MCGIAGVLALSAAAIDEVEASARVLSPLMARRGPDDEGFFSDGRACAMCFRRLAILDLSPNGHQPMLSADGRFVLAFNGEVYNFSEIKKELISEGFGFRSTGDTEVVLYALVRWGPDALSRLNGMFALAFYDTCEQRLLLARDHAGIKPLYYLHTGRGLVFASQYDQILAHQWSHGLRPSADAASLYFRFGTIPAPFALLEHTHLLPAGSWLSLATCGTLRRGRFFDLPTFTKPTLTGDAALEALDQALGRAVARHMTSDVPVGVLLSGGIDSPLVCAEACRVGGRLKAFTIGIWLDDKDESREASRYASALDVDHAIDRVRPEEIADLLGEVVAACTEPTADPSIIPMWMLSRLARHDVKVVLSGDGGDELFWGYPSRFAGVLGQASCFRYPRLARLGMLGLRKALRVGHATRDVLQPTIGRMYQHRHTLFSEKDLSACFPDLTELPESFNLFEFSGSDIDQTAQWLRWNEFQLHLAFILQKVDRASMYHSLEVRVPLLDREVIDVACRTDWRSCIDVQRRLGKLPLRRALSRRLGFETLPKKGFDLPMPELLAGPLAPLVRDELLNRRDVLGIPIDSRHVGRMYQRLMSGEPGTARGLWSLLSAAMWSRKHMGART